MLAASRTALFAANLFRSRVGRAFLAIRDQDIAAEASGVNLFRYKLTAFAVSSFFVGMSGALIAHYRTIVTWERFTLEVSILYLAMVIVGGLGSIVGSFLGASVITLLPALIATSGRALGRLRGRFLVHLIGGLHQDQPKTRLSSPPAGKIRPLQGAGSAL